MVTPPRMVSIVIRVCNERPSLEQLHREIAETAGRHGLDVEVILRRRRERRRLVGDDPALAAADPRVRGLRLRRNFGKSAALAAGLGAARGADIVTMDADLQDDPFEVPRLLEALDRGYDLASGWKRRRRDPWRKRVASGVFNAVVSRVTGVQAHDHNCGLKARTRRRGARRSSCPRGCTGSCRCSRTHAVSR